MNIELFPSLPFLSFAIDLATLSLVIILLLVSLLSLSLIFFLRFRTQHSHYLESFNALWTVRFLLVFFIILWALNEIIHLNILRRDYIYPLLSNLSIDQQDDLCKLHVVLSLGFLEPGFLVTLLFLLHVSIKKKTPNGSWALAFLLAICLPISLLQCLFVFVQRFEVDLVPKPFIRTSVIYRDGFNGKIVLCTYPLFSTLLFGAFGTVYSLYFLFSCWSVVSLVINKTLRSRIYTLAFTVLATLAVQVLFQGSTIFWTPKRNVFGIVAFLAFLSTFVCAVVGEGLLVIIPIIDSLAVGGDCCRWSPSTTTASFREDQGEESKELQVNV